MRAWQRVLTVQKENKMPELRTPRLMLSQERPPASRSEQRSTAGEMRSERKRAREEVRVSPRDRRDNSMSSSVITSRRMFREHQGTALARLL